MMQRVEGALTRLSDQTTLMHAPPARHSRDQNAPLRQYLTHCALIVLIGLVILGVWTASRLQQMVETEVGHRAATVLESMLNRHAEELAVDRLHPQLLQVMDSYYHDIAASLGVVEMKIWNADGTVLYASRPGLTGRALPVSPELETALAGEISVSVGNAFHPAPGQAVAATGPRLFEIYVPIRIRSLNRIVAVAEYYQNAAVATDALSRARWQTWAILAIVGAMFLSVLGLVLRHGDALISRQHRDLCARMAELSGRLDHSMETQSRIQQEARRQQEDQKAQMRQINADIHDGIGQLLTVALLRMKPAPLAGAPQEDSVQSVRQILEEAMSEVQALLSGTSQTPLPEMPLARAVTTIIDDHRRRTSTDVTVMMEEGLAEPQLPVKIAICRLVQEGLHNAFKHAGGKDQQVRLHLEGDRMVVTVSNRARHRRDAVHDAARRPMGLRNLRHRIESLGGTFQILDQPDQRIEIRASFPHIKAEDRHG